MPISDYMLHLNEGALYDYLDNEMVLESGSTSDSAILYRMGIYRLNYMPPDRTESIIKRFHINKDNPRPGILKYMREDTVPIMPDSEEVIHRSSWDLDSLVGETEAQLMHEDYYTLNKHIVSKHKKKHNVLTVLQCSSKKPYTENRAYKTNYFSVYKDYTDFACISNPGIIPLEYCGFYPYRYDEWNVMAEDKVMDEVDLTHKYRIVNMCRFIRYKRKMKYDDVIALIGNPKKQWIFDEMVKHDIDGAKSWLHIVTDGKFRSRLKSNDKYKDLFNAGGMAFSRIPQLPPTKKAFEKILLSCTAADDKDGLKKVIADREEHLKKNSKTNESLEKPQYKIKESLDYREFISNFKKEIKDNMDDPSVDKGDNKLFYKSYYWSCLDLLLIGLDGDLVEDIDNAYWKLMSQLKKDKDFYNFGGQLFAYKPLLENDKVSEKEIEKEAYDKKIIKVNKQPKLDKSIFK